MRRIVCGERQDQILDPSWAARELIPTETGDSILEVLVNPTLSVIYQSQIYTVN